MKYYKLVNYSFVTGDLASDASLVHRIFKDNHAPAHIHKRGMVYVIETEMEADDLWMWLPFGLSAEEFRYRNVVGIFTREDAEEIMKCALQKGGRVNYVSEAFDNVYLDIIESDKLDSLAETLALNIEKFEYVNL